MVGFPLVAKHGSNGGAAYLLSAGAVGAAGSVLGTFRCYSGRRNLASSLAPLGLRRLHLLPIFRKNKMDSFCFKTNTKIGKTKICHRADPNIADANRVGVYRFCVVNPVTCAVDDAHCSCPEASRVGFAAGPVPLCCFADVAFCAACIESSSIASALLLLDITWFPVPFEL